MHLVQSMAYVGETPWHGLGNQLIPNQPLEVWAQQAGMHWQIEEAEVRFVAGSTDNRAGLGSIHAFPEQKVLYRSDTKAPLSVVSGRYQVVQPREILEFYRDLTEVGGFELETAGVLKDGKKLWALARTGQSATLKGRDQVNGYLLLATACDGTLAGISNPAALVYLLMTDPDGTPDFGLDYVQQLPSGQWDIIGNQAADGTYIASFLGRVQYTDSADAANAHYESGLDIQIPSSVTVSGTTTGVGSAVVTGPGLPASGLWFQTAGNGTGAGYLEIPTATLTAPLTSISNRVNGGMSTTYKWAWAPISGSATSFSPSNLPEYAPSPQDASTITNFGVYTVTLYDTTGTEIRSEQIQNIARNYAAAAGGTVAWQTLGSDVIANYLTPGGSGTQSAPGTSASLDWTTPASSFYPNFWASINSLGAAQTSVPATTYDATVWGASTGNTPSPLTFNSSFTDVLTSTATATAEQAAQVQLGWQADGEFYVNTWQLNN